jgi:hypothetical protein
VLRAPLSPDFQRLHFRKVRFPVDFIRHYPVAPATL